jgi:hypothetical protein
MKQSLKEKSGGGSKNDRGEQKSIYCTISYEASKLHFHTMLEAIRLREEKELERQLQERLKVHYFISNRSIQSFNIFPSA